MDTLGGKGLSLLNPFHQPSPLPPTTWILDKHFPIVLLTLVEKIVLERNVAKSSGTIKMQVKVHEPTISRSFSWPGEANLLLLKKHDNLVSILKVFLFVFSLLNRIM